jgi:hypothetical protein
MLVDHPWEIMKANDIAEFHSQVHHFSWRMKSRTVSSSVRASGRWPNMMSIGISSVSAAPEEVSYLWYTKMLYNKIFADAELAIQPLINRIQRNMPSADKNKMKVNLFWWAEINHAPFQLVVNPELNLIGAEHLPLLAAPPETHVEAKVDVEPDWLQAVLPIMGGIREMGFNPAPFVSRAIPNVWIPNPLINVGSEDLMPRIISCLQGSIIIRVNGTESSCANTARRLPLDGAFHLKFLTQALFVLGFEI